MSRRFLAGQMPVAVAPPSQRTGPDPSLFESVAASFRTTIDEQDIPQADRLAEAYKPVTEALADMGVDYATLHPTRLNDPSALVAGQGAAPATANYLDPDAVWRAIGTIRQRNPKAFAGLPATRADFERGVLTRHGGRATDQATSARGGIGARLVGGAGASFADPVNVLTMPIGGGKTIGQTILRESVVNVATEAAQQFPLSRNLARMGETLTPEQAAMNVASAGLAGGVLAGAGKAFELHAAPRIAAGVERVRAADDRLTKATGERVASAAESALAKAWDHLPEPVRQRWASAAKVTDDDLPELAEMTIGRGNLTDDERAAMAVVLRERQIDAANPFVANGAGIAAHREQLSDAIARVLADNPTPARPSASARLSSTTALGSGTVTGSPARMAVKSRIAMAESSNGARYANPLSSARGKYQFLKGTWLRYYKARFGAGGLDDAAILAKRADPGVQDVLMDDLVADNAAFLRGHGEAETAGNLYLTHFAGQGGARKLFDADPAARAVDVLGADAVKANPWMRDMSVGDVIGWAARKMDEAPPARGGARVRLADDSADPDGLVQAELDRLQGDRARLLDEGADDAPDGVADSAEGVMVDSADSFPSIEPGVAQVRPDAPVDVMPEPVRQPPSREVVQAVRRYTADTRGSLDPAKVAKSLGISPEHAEQVLNDLTLDPRSSIVRTRDRWVDARRPDGSIIYERRGKGTKAKMIAQRVLQPGKIVRRPVRRGPVDLMRFLADAGGIRDNEGHHLAKGMGLQQLVPGAGPLIRPGGMSVDSARELAAEAGYFHGMHPDDAMSGTTEADFLDLLTSVQGTKHFTQQDLGEAAALAAEREYAAELKLVRDKVASQLQHHGFDFGRDQLNRAAEHVRANGGDVDDAIYRVIHEDLFDALDAGRLEAENDRYDLLAEDMERALAGGDSRRAGDSERPGADDGDAGQGGAGSAELRGGPGSEDGGLDPVAPETARAFDDPDAPAATALVDSLDHDLRAMIDPAIAKRVKQQTELKAAAPMRAAVDQDSTIGSPLFDAVDQTKLDLGDGKPVTLGEMFADLDAEQGAIDTVRSCL